VLGGVLLEHQGSEPICAARVQIAESEIRGLALESQNAPGLRLTDVVLRDCDLSNVDGREGLLCRVEIHDSRLVGFGLAGGKGQDLRLVDSTLSLASLAFAELHNVIFERVNLAEASFMEACLESVEFVDCKLAGTDFRRVRLKDCAIRGTPLDGVLGVESLKGLTMPWPDVIASAATLAAGLGIKVDFD
jgi:uncharacterized protein YjbI with pentapeptide repeats